MSRNVRGLECEKCTRQVFNRSYKFCPWCGKKFVVPKPKGIPFVHETKKRCEVVRVAYRD